MPRRHILPTAAIATGAAHTASVVSALVAATRSTVTTQTAPVDLHPGNGNPAGMPHNPKIWTAQVSINGRNYYVTHTTAVSSNSGLSCP